MKSCLEALIIGETYSNEHNDIRKSFSRINTNTARAFENTARRTAVRSFQLVINKEKSIDRTVYWA